MMMGHNIIVGELREDIGTKPWMAYLNMLRTQLGPGMLIMPLAISQAGIILGPMLALGYGLLLIHTHIMLLNCLTEICRQLKIPYLSYRYGFRLAILHGPRILRRVGRHGPQIIAIFMFLSQLGVCTIAVILSSDSLRDLMDWQSNNSALLTMLLPYLLLEYFMKSLSVISYVTVLGHFLNIIGLILVVVQALKDPVKVYEYETRGLMTLVFACGAFLCNLSAVSVILCLDKCLEEARIMRKRLGVISIGMIVPTIMVIGIGTLGYWSFGTMDENVLRVLPLDEPLSLTIIAMYLVSVTLAYPLQCYPAIAVVIEVVKYHDPLSEPSKDVLRKLEIFGRPIFVCLTFFICYCVPFQAPVVAFVGNLCTTLISVVFPALMDICLRYPNNYGKHNYILIKNAIIIFIGSFGFVFGVPLCGYIIYVRLLSANSPNSHGYY